MRQLPVCSQTANSLNVLIPRAQLETSYQRNIPAAVGPVAPRGPTANGPLAPMFGGPGGPPGPMGPMGFYPGAMGPQPPRGPGGTLSPLFENRKA